MDMDKTALGVIDNDDRTQMVSAPASNATQMAMNVDCPVCRTPNPPSETYCIDCGFLLASAPVDLADMPEMPSVGKLISTDGMREFPLNPGMNTVGRESADILLAHNTVSRKHATVTVEDGHVYVEDSGSTNGTTVAGVKIAAGEKAELTDGCEVVFGSFALKYEAPVQTDEVSTDEVSKEAEATEKTEMIETEPEAQEDDTEPVEDTFGIPFVEEEVKVGARLVSKDGAISFDIHEGTCTIGRRDGDNDIVIPDPYCSGRHANISFADGKFILTDIGSTNGTLVNGVKLDINAPHEVQQGDEITLGRTVFRLEVN